MKKIIATSILALAFLVSCTETKVDADNKVKDGTETSTKDQHEQNESEPEVNKDTVEITVESLNMDFKIHKFYESNNKMYIDASEFTIEEVDNTFDRSTPIGAIRISDEVKTFLLEDEAYFDCAESKKVSIKDLEKKWKIETELPLVIKVEKGIVKRLFFEECAG